MDQARFVLEKDFSGDFASASRALEIGLRERLFRTIEIGERLAVFQTQRMGAGQVDAIQASGRVELTPTASGVRLAADFAQITKIEKVLRFVRWLDRVILIGVAVGLYYTIDEQLFALAPIAALLVNEAVFHFILPKTFRRIETEARAELEHILTAALQAAG